MLEVLDIDRIEVKRMVNRYTLGNYTVPDDVLNQDYLLVCYSVNGDYFYDRTTYRIFYPARPSILDGGSLEFCQKKGYLDFDSEYIHFYSDGSSRIFCYEIWHLVDDIESNINDDLSAIHAYEAALDVIETSDNVDDVEIALDTVDWFERNYVIKHDCYSFYSVTTYSRKHAILEDLEELRFAGCVEHA